MALDINIRITLDSEGAYSDREQSILSALAAHPSQGAAAEWPPADRTNSNPAPVPEATPATPKAAPKAAPKTRAPKAAPVKVVPEPDVPMALDDAEELPGDPQDQAPAPAEELPEPKAEPKTTGGQLTTAGGEKLNQPVNRTIDGAVTVVTELVGKGKIALAKSALEAAGVKKVSAIETDDQLAAFFSVLEG